MLLLLTFEVLVAWLALTSIWLLLRELRLLCLDGSELLLILQLLLMHLLALYLSNALINHCLGEVVCLVDSDTFSCHFLL